MVPDYNWKCERCGELTDHTHTKCKRKKALIYLAAAYQRKDEMAGYAIALRKLGYRVEARWFEQTDHEADPEKYLSSQVQQFAYHDIEDLKAADWVMNFTGVDGKGGRHVEFGLALAWNKPQIIVGPMEHVFHWIPGIPRAINFSRALAVLESWEGRVKSGKPIPTGRITA